MTESRHSWTDADVDRALTRFFAAECPSDLPGSPMQREIARPPVELRSERRLSARGMLATIAAAIVATASLIVIAPPARPPAAIEQTAARPPQEIVVTMTEPGPREIFATTSGLMRQQTDLKVTTVSWVAPDTGEAVEWQVPELAIDIVPVAANDAGELR